MEDINLLDELTPDEEVGTVDFNGWAGFYHDVPDTGWYMIQINKPDGTREFELHKGQFTAQVRWTELEMLLEPNYDEPEPEDWVIQDMPQDGYHVRDQQFDDYPSAVHYIRQQARMDNFFPNVWYMDDHGGFRLITEDVFTEKTRKE